MPISAAGNRALRRSGGRRTLACGGGPSRAKNAREGGFTLIELMVVVTIIGLASAAAVWALPDPRGRLIDEAGRFALRTRAAHDLAIVDARPVSVWVTRGGYGFDERTAGGWTPIADKPLRVAEWSAGTRADTAQPGGRMRVTFDSTGLVDRPADIQLERGSARTLIRLGGDGSVQVVADGTVNAGG